MYVLLGLVECPKEGVHFLPHPATCRKFVKCNDGLYRIVECIDGLHFDPHWQWCDFPDYVDCDIEEVDSKNN